VVEDEGYGGIPVFSRGPSTLEGGGGVPRQQKWQIYCLKLCTMVKM
jgi:hypothetical protein